jgi:mannose-6-phosphate isomerase-like protein (cupin superfamily)
MVYVRNWREFQPKIAHLSAVHWGGLRPRAEEGGDADDRDRLERLGGFARHALQGGKTSDHHKHECLEQVYYILSGKGEVLCGDIRYPVEAGDAVYLPAGLPHQMFNDASDSWLEHHVISMPVDENGGDLLIRNWCSSSPLGDGAGAIRWHQLGQVGDEEAGCLRSMVLIDREAVQPGGRTVERCYGLLEQVYYVLENRGIITVDGEEASFREGDMIHLPPAAEYSISNPHPEWVSYLIMAA